MFRWCMVYSIFIACVNHSMWGRPASNAAISMCVYIHTHRVCIICTTNCKMCVSTLQHTPLPPFGPCIHTYLATSHLLPFISLYLIFIPHLHLSSLSFISISHLYHSSPSFIPILHLHQSSPSLALKCRKLSSIFR